MKQFKCWNPDEADEEDADDITAIDPEGAAEVFAERRDSYSGEGYSDKQTVYVRDEEGGFHMFNVQAETEVVYSAEEVELPDND